MFNTRDIAAVYDQIGLHFSATRPSLPPETVKLLPKLKAKARILDLGSGNGVLLTALDNSLETSYLGIDISQTMVNEAKRLHPDHHFQLGDITNRQFWQKLPRFDFIAALSVFHHLPDQKSHLYLLSQIKKHLTPSGTALVSIWNLDQTKYQKRPLIPFHGGIKRPFYVFDRDEFILLMKKIGFRDTMGLCQKDNLYYLLKPKSSNAQKKRNLQTPLSENGPGQKRNASAAAGRAKVLRQ